MEDIWLGVRDSVDGYSRRRRAVSENLTIQAIMYNRGNLFKKKEIAGCRIMHCIDACKPILH
jgi:hypothetical protein